MDLATEQVIHERVQCGVFSGKAMLSTFRMLDEESRNTSAYYDPRYAPFYYILGQELPVKSVLEFGFGIGIASGCYVRGCKTVESILSFQETGKSYYSSRIGIHNLKNYFKGVLDVYAGKVNDQIFADKLNARKFDLGILNEERDYDTMMMYFDVMWEHLADEGTLVVDFARSNEIVAKAYESFVKRHGRAKRMIGTKYGVGVISK